MRTSLAFMVLAILFSDADQVKLVQRMTKQLRSRDVAERVDAADTLGKIKIPEAVAPLGTALADQDARVRQAAASSLWELSDIAKDAIPALRKMLSDSDVAVVMRAAGALIAMDVPKKELAEPLRNVLQDGDSTDRFLAARALTGIDPAGKLAPPMLDYLRKELHSDRDNYDMARKALHNLGKENDRSAIAPMMAELRKSPQIAEPILIALGEFKPPPDQWIETLIGQLDVSNPKVRGTAAELLGKQKAKASDVKMWAGPVSRLCNDADAGVRGDAVRALQGAGGLALDGLDGVLHVVSSDSDADLRARAAEAVGEMASAQFAIDAQLKIAAAKKALPVLTAAADKDASHEVRHNAVRSLDQLQLPKETIVPLLARIAVAQQDTQDVRWSSLLALRNRGRDAASAADTIRPLASDPNADVRQDAQATLDAFTSDYIDTKHVAQTAATDPDAREHALEYLRENKLEMSESAFYRALLEADVEQVKNYLDAGMSPNLRFANSYGDPVLRAAIERDCQADEKTIVRLLIARGADAKAADDRGNTALMEAAQKCDAEVVKMLLKAGADMNAKNKMGLTAFEFGMWNASPGAAAIAAAGYRLPADKVKMYRDAYKTNPKILALIDKASAGKATSAKK